MREIYVISKIIAGVFYAYFPGFFPLLFSEISFPVIAYTTVRMAVP